MWRNFNPPTLLTGLKNDAATLENSLTVPQKVKHRYYKTQKFRSKIYMQKHWNMNVHSSISHSSQKNNTNVHQLMNGLTKRGISIQWNINLAKKINEVLIRTTTWMSLENMPYETSQPRRPHVV